MEVIGGFLKVSSGLRRLSEGNFRVLGSRAGHIVRSLRCPLTRVLSVDLLINVLTVLLCYEPSTVNF